jgi:hypothetical protein
MFALVERETGAVVGFCGLVHPQQQVEAELKYAFLRSAWGRGLATEARAACSTTRRRRSASGASSRPWRPGISPRSACSRRRA